MIKNHSLATRLSIAFLIIGILPASTVGWLAVSEAERSLTQQAFHQLESVRELKKGQIENLIKQLQTDLQTLAALQQQALRNAAENTADRSSPAFSQQNRQSLGITTLLAHLNLDFLNQYTERIGLHNLLLIHPGGNVFYSTTRESDLGTHVLNGSSPPNGLAEAFRKALDSRKMQFQDFAPYAPSGQRPAAFIALPVLHEDQVALVIVAQITPDRLNAIMQQRGGMGQTGETYLVGPDQRMRSDSYLDPKNRSVKASFAGTIADNGVNTVASYAALAGQTATRIISDYRGNSVLSAYTPVQFGDATWALIAEIDQAEAFAAVEQLRWLTGGVLAVAIGLMALLAWRITHGITRPLRQAVAAAERIAQGDLTGPIKAESQDETGQLLTALHAMQEELQQMAGDVQSATETAGTAASEVAQSSADLMQRTEEQASALQETASSIQQLTRTVQRSVDRAQQAKLLARQTCAQAERSGEVVNRTVTAMNVIRASSHRIADITSTIDDIAFQTHLLALNAAVEAAHAGPQGQGFAVVAEEIQKLAQNSATAAREIKALISESTTKIENGSHLAQQSGHTLREIVVAIRQLSDTVADLATASCEQANSIQQVHRTIRQIDQTTQQNSALAQETTATSHTMSLQVDHLRELMGFFKLKEPQTKPVVNPQPMPLVEVAKPHLTVIDCVSGPLPLIPAKPHARPQLRIVSSNPARIASREVRE